MPSNGQTKKPRKHRGQKYGVVELCNAVQARLQPERPGWRVGWERHPEERGRIYILASHDAAWAQRILVARSEIARWALRAYPMHGVATVMADSLLQLIDEIVRDLAQGGVDAIPMRPGLAAQAKRQLGVRDG
jgi:hypothetical protein